MKRLSQAIGVAMLGFWALPAFAQFTVLDNAQDAGTSAPVAEAPPPVCGTAPISIARMAWPSAAILAEIHARVLAEAYECEVSIVSGDLAATASSMGSTGQPSVAPEMWVTRIADVWNGAIEGQMVRSVAPSFAETQFEGWFIPDTLAAAFDGAPSPVGLGAVLPAEKVRFISCPIDWACAVINRNLIEAYGLADRVEIVEPANRFEMDSLIGEAVNRREPFIFYYWQPNAILGQIGFVPLDMGAFDEAAAQCLANRVCADPKPSAFPGEAVVIALSDRVFTEAPAIAGYFQRATFSLAEMDQLLARLNEPGASVESVAERFVAERGDVWRGWTGPTP